MMTRCLLCLTLALAPAAATAQGADPMQSATCQQALRAVEVQEVEVAAARQVDPLASLPRNRAALARLEALRQRAAQVCLAGRPDRPSSRPGQQNRPSSRPDRQAPR
jgi:hypothetical protein